jgi:putative aldouronate transport system substrate-binding protein
MQQKNQLRKPLIAGLSLALGFTALAGCGGKTEGQSSGGQGDAGKPFEVSIMVPSFNTDLPKEETSKVWQQMEQYTGTKVNILFTPNSSYEDKLNITLASGNMPMVTYVGSTKLPSIANAIKAGAFWEVGPYLKDYPNLSQANPDVLNNISTEGKIYGIYRARPLGRMGISFRKDWLDNLGMQEPKTIDDFYNMLKAFTYNDPDKNGKDDTYGMVVTKYSGPWDIMQTWFGAPNKWGLDSGGKLVPAFMTPEYMDALKFFKKLYDEKLVNPDFAVMDSAKWTDPVVNGKAGVIVDVADQAQRLEQKLADVDPKAKIDVMGAVSGPKGLRNLPTSGYGGLFVISKQSVKTEADLKKVLTFLDKLNDQKMQTLLNDGIEGEHYKVEDGRKVSLAKDPLPPELNNHDLNQLLMYIPNRVDGQFKPETPLRGKVAQVQKDNEKIIVPNPAEPLDSPTYTQKGVQLDKIIEDARIQFIVGKIDENGFKAAIDLWKKSGGDDYIKEINESYAKSKK